MVPTGGPQDKPAFLDPERAESLGYVSGDVATFDHELIAEDPSAPTRGVIDRYREIARLKAHGYTNNQVCAILGYTPARVSIILKDPFVQAEIKKWRDQFFSADAVQIMKETAIDSARRVQKMVNDPKTEDRVVLQIAQMAIDHTHGKAKQSVSVENGTLQNFIDLMREMKGRGETLDVTPKPVIEATPAAITGDTQQEDDKWDSWLGNNL